MSGYVRYDPHTEKVYLLHTDLGLPEAECAVFASCYISLLHVTFGWQADHASDHVIVLDLATCIT